MSNMFLGGTLKSSWLHVNIWINTRTSVIPKCLCVVKHYQMEDDEEEIKYKTRDVKRLFISLKMSLSVSKMTFPFY